jgi:hypothetical protein
MLTKEQVKILKTVDDVSCRLIESTNVYPCTSSSELQLKVATKIGSNMVFNTVGLAVESYVTIYDSKLKGQPLKGFSYQDRHLKAILNNEVKAGDVLVLNWLVGSHTCELLSNNGLESDSLELTIRRGNKEMTYLISVQTSEADSSARMIQIGKYDLDHSRLMI